MIRTDDMDTDGLLDRVVTYAEDHDVDAFCVASTSGETGAKAAERFGEDLVVVGHSYGFDEENEQELDAEHVAAIEAAGGDVFVGPMACDAGLVDSGSRVLSIAGTGSGADTALLVRAANTRDFFDARVLDVVAKPADAENLSYW